MSELVGKNGGGLLIYSVRKSKPIPLDLSLGAFSDLWPVGRFVLGTIHLRRPQNLLRMRTLFAFDSKTHDGYQGSLAFYFCFWVFAPPLIAIVICDGLLSAFFSLSPSLHRIPNSSGGISKVFKLSTLTWILQGENHDNSTVIRDL